MDWPNEKVVQNASSERRVEEVGVGEPV